MTLMCLNGEEFPTRINTGPYRQGHWFVWIEDVFVLIDNQQTFKRMISNDGGS